VDSHPLPSGRDFVVETERQHLREFVDELRQEWKLMWRSRIDDHVRAEGIADRNYQRLFVDRGLVLLATRRFRPPDFYEILRKHLGDQEAENANPTPARGGIRKFIRENITTKSPKSTRVDETRAALENMRKRQQKKKGGRGWLHISFHKV